MAAAETDRGPNIQQRSNIFFRMMNRHPEICCLLSALVFTLLTRYSKSINKPYVMNQPLPRRFFPAASQVIDYPFGNLVEVGQLLGQEEILFVMYYAPWCAQSNHMKKEFEKAANFMQNEVLFIGINCWYPDGACRKLNNFMSYPMFYVYHTNLDGYLYSGPYTADYMVRFLQRILYPLEYLKTPEDIASFMVESDTSVIGYFDFNSSPQPPGFLQYYFSSMRILESEHKNVIRYGVITNKQLAQDTDLEYSGHVILIRTFNKTIKYPESDNFTSSAITKWVLQHRGSHSVKWIHPPGGKSLLLNNELQKGPTLMVFTPNTPLEEPNQYFNMVREVALDYLNCDKNEKMSDVIQRSIYNRLLSMKNYLDLLYRCSHPKTSINIPVKPLIPPAKKCCVSMVIEDKARHNHSCDVCVNFEPTHPQNLQSCRFVTPALSDFHLAVGIPSCMEIKPTYNPLEYVSMCCQKPPIPVQQSVTASPMGKGIHYKDQSTDPYVHFYTSKLENKLCRDIRKMGIYGWLPNINIPNLGLDKHATSKFTGQGCLTNKTLSFLVLDNKESSIFATRMGIDLGSQKNQTAAVIFDKKVEAYYILKEEVHKSNLVSFIENFIQQDVDPHRRSATSLSKPCSKLDKNICILEVTASSFDQIVMEEDKDVVVLHYTPWCGFCAGFSHVYLQLAKYFQSAKNVTFARINGEVNDLPWQFTAGAYPTVQLYPAHKKDDSVTFPDYLPKTLPNLIQFLLRHIKIPMKLEAGLTVCSEPCLDNNRRLSGHRVHTLTAELYAQKQKITKLETLIKNNNYQIKMEEEKLRPDLTLKASSLKHLAFLEGMLHRHKRTAKYRKLQLHTAKKLYSALVTSQGLEVDHNRVIALLKRREQYSVALENERDFEGSLWDMEEDIKEGRGPGLLDMNEDNNEERNEKDSHDEL